MADYDIFISFRSTDADNQPTRDAAMAEDLYYALCNKGFHPFFSKICIDGAGQSNYVRAIMGALETAKVFVAVGTTRENLDSDWVAEERSKFFGKRMNEIKKAKENPKDNKKPRTLLSYVSPDFPLDELPMDLIDLQSFTDEAAVVRFISVCLNEASGFRGASNDTNVLLSENGTTILTGKETPGNPPPIAKESDKPTPSWMLKTGDLLNDRYTILRVIGRGGTSCVYLATDQKLNRTCAVKELRQDAMVESSTVADGLLSEVALLQTLDHPAIPKVYDVIRRNGTLCIVMEYIEGRSLQKACPPEGFWKESAVLGIARQLGEVLQYLHTRPQPIIYRDLKPMNVILRPNGLLTLIDYGTARRYRPEATSDTTCLGTIGYAAPEQFGGMGQTDARTDIYNLGATLYNLVTGRNPSAPPYEILPIREVDPELSRGLEYIIQKCTQKDPEKRFQSAAEFLDALAHIDTLGKRTLRERLFESRKPKKPEPTILPAGRIAPDPRFAPPGSVPTQPMPRPVSSREDFDKAWASRTNTPVPQRPGAFVPPAAPPAQPRDPELEALIRKLRALDPESRKLVASLIDRLSK